MLRIITFSKQNSNDNIQTIERDEVVRNKLSQRIIQDLKKEWWGIFPILCQICRS
ncbi:hypothetical protein K5E_21420 [Enterococcus thailandicus]|nr:hypothetical protein K4E_06420 [Enterococcus thailandicus]GMC10003.1 hypothetical protein K5E_21420 [Enterococcus thailandicus]